MVYLHVPFCRSFCTYCDFYSEIACKGRDAQLFEPYAEAVCAEAWERRDEIAATRDLNTLYIGGGTPSVLPLSYLERLVRTINLPTPPRADGNYFSDKFAEKPISAPPSTTPSHTDAPFSEFTIEVNPEDITEKGESYVRGLLELGVNRVSMGVQSLDDGILRWMNRRHNAARARQAFRILRDAGVKNISVDVIFGLSQLSEAVLEETLREIIAWRPEHVSAYQLSVEEGSALADLVRSGRYVEASQEQCAAQYALLCERLSAAGYVHYEISNWALPGFEAVHNSAYWSRHPYVGLGPAAHSFHDRTRSWNEYSLRSYLLSLRSTSGPATACAGGKEVLSEQEVREEKVMLGLRTAKGVPEAWVDAAKAAEMLADGRLVRLDGGRVRIPEGHWFVSDAIVVELI